MLPFFLRHYAPIAEQIFIYDDGSDDRSLELLSRELNVTVEPIATGTECYVESLRTLYNECWKRSRGHADWVIVCNIDELMYHSAGLSTYLDDCFRAGATAIPCRGYQMVADQFPPAECSLPETIRRGVRWSVMDKLCVFSPDAVENVGYAVGRHSADPIGTIFIPAVTEMVLLHYKYLGFEYVQRRNNQLQTRRRPGDLANEYGYQYAETDERIRRKIATFIESAEDVVVERGDEAKNAFRDFLKASSADRMNRRAA